MDLDQLELWGQIGATLYLTPEEAEAFLTPGCTTEPHFINLIKERRYEINDQFYAPDFDDTDPESIRLNGDIFINLNETEQRDSMLAEAASKMHLKIWCRMGIVFFIDSEQLETLKSQDNAAADLVFDLIRSTRYEVQGSCLFESGIEKDGYICPDTAFSIDYFSQQGASENQQGPVMSL